MARARRISKRRPRLAYRVTVRGYFEVFVVEVRLAERIHRLNTALESCATWGALRRSVSIGDYKWIRTHYFGRPRKFDPGPDEPFEASNVYGFEDGDYPPWAKQSIERYVPMDLLKKHAQHEANMINGFWWTIPIENWPELKRDLELRGYKLVERADLTQFR